MITRVYSDRMLLFLFVQVGTHGGLPAGHCRQRPGQGDDERGRGLMITRRLRTWSIEAWGVGLDVPKPAGARLACGFPSRKTALVLLINVLRFHGCSCASPVRQWPSAKVPLRAPDRVSIGHLVCLILDRPNLSPPDVTARFYGCSKCFYGYTVTAYCVLRTAY